MTPPGQARVASLGVLRRLRPFVAAHGTMLFVAGLTLPFLAGAQLVAPYLLRVAIDALDTKYDVLAVRRDLWI